MKKLPYRPLINDFRQLVSVNASIDFENADTQVNTLEQYTLQAFEKHLDWLPTAMSDAIRLLAPVLGWDIAREYFPDECVIYGSKYYICLTQVTGERPDTSANWQENELATFYYSYIFAPLIYFSMSLLVQKIGIDVSRVGVMQRAETNADIVSNATRNFLSENMIVSGNNAAVMTYEAGALAAWTFDGTNYTELDTTNNLKKTIIKL
jgi:hypothetical protein